MVVEKAQRRSGGDVRRAVEFLVYEVAVLLTVLQDDRIMVGVRMSSCRVCVSVYTNMQEVRAQEAFRL